MKFALLLFFLLSAQVWGLLTWVRARNTAVATGAAAYARGDAAQAAGYFSGALKGREQKNPDPNLVLNLAHAQAKAGLLPAAQATYARLLTEKSASIGSVARQQLATLAAARGETAQALSLLRQALLLNPGNNDARYNYEVLSEYLTKQGKNPKIPPSPKGAAPDARQKPSEKNTADQNQTAEKSGTDRQGAVNDPKPAQEPTQPQSRPNAAGQADKQQASPTPGNAAAGHRAPGTGISAPVNSGDTPGNQRGLDRSAAASSPLNRGQVAGSAAAAPTDLQLQTQRERLQAMNLSPAQARQLLETLRAQEQQYLQQQTRPVKTAPNPNQPTW